MTREPHAHRSEDLSALPRVTREDVWATLMAIGVVAIILVLASLDYVR